MRFTEFVTTQKPLLQDFINNYLESRKSDTYADSRYYKETLEELSSLTRSGKMLRGLFIPCIYELLSSKTHSSRMLYASAAIELLQTALITHDDIIDNDHQRRGQQTIFSRYIDYGKQAGYPRATQYGQNMGICVGDIAIFLGYDLLNQAATSVEQLQKLHTVFSREMQLVCIGEMLDIEMAESEKEPSQDEIIHMYRCKTARYSFSLPFMMGAILSDASEETVLALSRIGEDMGILFQIKDDELGLIGKTEQTGKPVGADIAENKKTIHRALLMQFASPSDKARLGSLFGKRDISQTEHQEIVAYISLYNIIEQVADVTKLIEKRINSAIQAMSVSDEAKQALRDITEFITRRST